jgi:hypothetical protein
MFQLHGVEAEVAEEVVVEAADVVEVAVVVDTEEAAVEDTEVATKRHGLSIVLRLYQNHVDYISTFIS